MYTFDIDDRIMQKYKCISYISKDGKLMLLFYFAEILELKEIHTVYKNLDHKKAFKKILLSTLFIFQTSFRKLIQNKNFQNKKFQK